MQLEGGFRGISSPHVKGSDSLNFKGYVLIITAEPLANHHYTERMDQREPGENLRKTNDVQAVTAQNEKCGSIISCIQLLVLDCY